jgi:hypothetical protein
VQPYFFLIGFYGAKTIILLQLIASHSTISNHGKNMHMYIRKIFNIMQSPKTNGELYSCQAEETSLLAVCA